MAVKHGLYKYKKWMESLRSRPLVSGLPYEVLSSVIFLLLSWLFGIRWKEGTIFGKRRGDVETACMFLVLTSTCRSPCSPALMHTLLYGLFDSKWTIIYLMKIMLNWRRLETRDWKINVQWSNFLTQSVTQWQTSVEPKTVECWFC